MGQNAPNGEHKLNNINKLAHLGWDYLLDFYWQLQAGRPSSNEQGSLRHGSRAEKLPIHKQKLKSPQLEVSQDKRGQVMKRSPDLTESASSDKLHCQKEEEFLTCWAYAVSTGSKWKQG